MTKEFLDYDGLVLYDSNIKNYVSDSIETKHANDATTSDVAALSTPAGTNLLDLSEDIIDAAAQAFMNATEETALVVITTEVQGVSVSNLLLNVYYNGSDLLAQLVSTDNNGMVAFKVPNGYTYKIVFPDIVGCKPITPVLHTAAVLQRSIEVEYIEEVLLQEEEETEKLIVKVTTTNKNVISAKSDFNINVTYDGTTTTYTTDNTGIATAYIPLGKNYTITYSRLEGYYIIGGIYQVLHTAVLSVRQEHIRFRTGNGLSIITEDGLEYDFDTFKEKVELDQTYTVEQAIAIKISSAELVEKNGVFAIPIDELRSRTGVTSTSWSNQNILCTTIPTNGNSVTAEFYYNGLGATHAIIDWGNANGVETSAASWTNNKTLTINNVPYEGFLGSVGQWTIAWENRSQIDEILEYTRPSGTYLFSTYTTNKWTSTQYSATVAWYWTSAATNAYNKSYSSVVVPFFAI